MVGRYLCFRLYFFVKRVSYFEIPVFRFLEASIEKLFYNDVFFERLPHAAGSKSMPAFLAHKQPMLVETDA